MSFRQLLVKGLFFLQGVFTGGQTVCPYCEGTHFEIVARKAWVIRICHCLDCELYWTHPIFKFYKFYDLLYEGHGMVTRTLRGAQLEEALSNNFKNTDRNYSDFLAGLSKTVNGRKLLEFGSSWGYFLLQARKEGFDATGVEISEKRSAFGRDQFKLNIVSHLDVLISAGMKYDAIVTFHVLEHLTSLRKIFEKFSMLLSEKGVLVIEVPFLDAAKGKDPFEIIGAVHPLAFSKRFFEINMPREGFEVVFEDRRVVCRKTSNHGSAFGA